MTQATTLADEALARQFFETLYGAGGCDDGWLVLSSRGSQFAPVAQYRIGESGALDEAAQVVVAGAMAGDDVYYSCSLMRSKIPRGRGRETDALLVPGVWAEVDFGSDGHSSTELLSELDTLNVVQGAGVWAPSMVIRSGGGFHLYWLLDQPFRVDSEEGVRAVRRANRGVAEMLKRAGIPRVDPVADLARVLRPAGTKNWKLGADRPRDVSIVAAPGYRYTWEQASPYLFSLAPDDGASRTRVAFEGPSDPAALAGIVDGCAWMRHCRDDAASLPEPEWHGMATILALVDDGHQVMHEWSKPHAGYSVNATDTKFDAAVQANAPVRCSTAREKAGTDRWCQGCAFNGAISSPIQLGRRAAWVEKERLEETPLDVRWRERELSDDGNALRYVDLWGERVRYVAKWKTWLIWDGLRWKRDERGLATQLARQTSRSIEEEARQVADVDHELAKVVSKWGRSSQSAGRVNAMVNLAASDPVVVVVPEELDRHPWLLNVQNGTLDLRTGELRAPVREELMTQAMTVAWRDDAPCPMWENFLLEVTGGDIEMVAFLRRIAGYSLTGRVSEQVFFFLYGSGQNGKGTFVHTLRLLLGDYATTAESGLLMESKHDAHPTGLADLFATRFVVASESKSGRKLDEEVVKQLTGDDSIKARRLFENNFDFEPTHKLWLMANSKPIINDATYAMWRRLILVPFEVQIPEDHKDENLREKMLAGESEGILRWLVEGCLEWQRHGLVMPAKVIEATGLYQDSEDLVGRFLTERMVVEQGATVTTKDVMAAYSSWCFDMSVYQLPTRQFRETLEQKGFGEVKRALGSDGKEGRGFRGLRISMELRGTSFGI